MGKHIPVLLDETIENLNIRDGGIYVDLTLGRGGHSSEILKRIPNGQLICFDVDKQAIEESKERLSKIGSNFTIIKSNYSSIKEQLEKIGIKKVDGILADLGVSSPQLDDPNRGFSYNFDSRLDMRMDQDSELSAYEVVNNYKEEDLSRIIFAYGEDYDARKIAKSIVKSRPIETTFQLVDAIKRAKSFKDLAKKGHPAKQTFQAIRMEVNRETSSLKAMLADAPDLLKSKGRLAIITFMSLDDREVKNRFKELTVIEGSRKEFTLENKETDFVAISRKPIIPSEKELELNHRAASAKLRVIERK